MFSVRLCALGKETVFKIKTPRVHSDVQTEAEERAEHTAYNTRQYKQVVAVKKIKLVLGLE
jgi:hypothetical protein